MIGRRACVMLTVSLTIVSGSLLFVHPASAATEIGTRCTAVAGSVGTSAVNGVGPSTLIPANGVITRWGTDFPPAGTPFPMTLAIMRGSGVNWTVTGVSSRVFVSTGPSEHLARVPVTAGDRIGLTDTLSYCAAAAPDAVNAAVFAEPPVVGSALVLGNSLANATTSLWATIEADVDLDGFGDETQDLCPQSAAFQATCPTTTLSVLRSLKRTGLRALVTTSLDSTVIANATVKLPARKGKRARTLKFKSKRLATGPGRVTTINLKWPRSLTGALGALSSRSSLAVKVKFSADGIVTDTARSYTLRLKGRG